MTEAELVGLNTGLIVLSVLLGSMVFFSCVAILASFDESMKVTHLRRYFVTALILSIFIMNATIGAAVWSKHALDDRRCPAGCEEIESD